MNVFSKGWGQRQLVIPKLSLSPLVRQAAWSETPGAADALSPPALFSHCLIALRVQIFQKPLALALLKCCVD